MLSLIEVTCPHCAAHGQIMLPPLGAIIIGPCPECHGMVAVFCGRVLPLDKETMTDGTAEEKRHHLGSVLGEFLRERIGQLFAGDEQSETLAFEEDVAGVDEEAGEELDAGVKRPEVFNAGAAAPISPEELESFKKIDLRLLDNRDYFKAIFESN